MIRNILLLSFGFILGFISLEIYADIPRLIEANNILSAEASYMGCMMGSKRFDKINAHHIFCQSLSREYLLFLRSFR